MRIVIGVLFLFFLILFHEVGHLVVAILCGVKVESFSLGFGPALLHKTFRGIDWRLSLFPLGGYCGLKGEGNVLGELEGEDLRPDPDSLYGVHPLKRAAVGFGGPLSNLIFSFLAFTAIAALGYTYETYSNKVIMADETHDIKSTAHEAGLLTGDRIIAINGRAVSNFSDLIEEVRPRGGEVVVITVERKMATGGAAKLKFSVPVIMGEDGAGKIGVAADTKSLESVTEKSKGILSPVAGLCDTVSALGLTYKGLLTLFRGADIRQSVTGPSAIVDMIGFSASAGVVALLRLLAYISISLFVMNMLPIPILDGALILFALIDCITKKRLPLKAQLAFQLAGLLIIVSLFVIAVMGDFHYWTGGRGRF